MYLASSSLTPKIDLGRKPLFDDHPRHHSTVSVQSRKWSVDNGRVAPELATRRDSIIRDRFLHQQTSILSGAGLTRISQPEPIPLA
ncbi:hypothetical protein VTH82DRAFT_2594 [Thermothelomyces myriococcoides]